MTGPVPVPRPRPVDLTGDVAHEVAAAFDLGPVRTVALAARGWASLNVLWRFDTGAGTFAVKEVTRDGVDALEAAGAIEVAAAAAGVALPEVIRSTEGGIAVEVDGRVFRCHRFVEGVVPTASLTAADAHAIGEALGRLHAARLPPDEVRTSTPYAWGRAHWEELAASGEAAGAPWPPALRRALRGILAAEAAAEVWASVPHHWIGGHKDVRPDNALRVGDRLLLVDWDSAGPSIAGREVAGALRSWTPFEAELLAGYDAEAGPIDLAEGAGEDGTLVWWLELNVRAALARPDDEERAWAVGALAAGFLESPPPG